jgi:hypothetical protein
MTMENTNLYHGPWPGVRAVLRVWIHAGKIDQTHADALMVEIRNDLRDDTETRECAYENLKNSE